MMLVILSFFLNQIAFSINKCEKECLIKHLECKETMVGESKQNLEPKQPDSQKKEVKKNSRDPDNVNFNGRSLAASPSANPPDNCDENQKKCLENCNESN